MNCYQAQKFGENLNPLYSGQGLKGHTGCDTHCGYGTDILSRYKGYVHDVKTVQTAGPSGYTFVSILVEDGIECFDYQVGHCDPTVKVGDLVNVGDKIGTEGNHGPVYSGNRQITLAEQLAGNHEGSHRHEQKRPLKRSNTPPYGLNKGYNMALLTIPLSLHGCYYEIFDFFNGFNGCVDLEKSIFQRYLTIGMTGYDVACLQRYLKINGFLNADATGFYGALTFAAVSRYQKANGLQGVGSVGPATLKLLSIIK